MIRKLLLGGLLGGLAMFVYLSLSWTVIPFHMNGMQELPDVAAMMGNVAGLEHEVYYSGMPEEGVVEPVIPFMVFAPGGYEPQPVILGKGLLMTLLAALLVTFVVMAARQPVYRSRVMLCTIIGAAIALAGPMTFGNFFYFPFEFIWPEILDQLVGWTLAGFIIAWATKPQLATISTAGA
jgi:hypothetical protein